eukprot:3638363-Lingulodinium_polyedra.AAC.1
MMLRGQEVTLRLPSLERPVAAAIPYSPETAQRTIALLSVRRHWHGPRGAGGPDPHEQRKERA